MLIEKVNKLKMETHQLLHLVGLLQFMVNENSTDEILNKSVKYIDEQLKLLKALNDELKQMSKGE